MRSRLARGLLVAAVAALLGPAPAAVASPDPGLLPASLSGVIPGCACDENHKALADYRDRIASATSIDAARDLATSETSLARKALGSARWFVPTSTKVAAAHETLVDYEQRVARAQTSEQAAAAFGELVRLESRFGPLADVDIDIDGGGCDYSTGELIAILIGFVLGIVPGIILLFLLC